MTGTFPSVEMAATLSPCLSVTATSHLRGPAQGRKRVTQASHGVRRQLHVLQREVIGGQELEAPPRQRK